LTKYNAVELFFLIVTVTCLPGNDTSYNLIKGG
jgi:hypothetical protein